MALSDVTVDGSCHEMSAAKAGVAMAMEAARMA
jgi:hypothetical protein